MNFKRLVLICLILGSFCGKALPEENVVLNIWQYVEKRASNEPKLVGELYFKGQPLPENLKKEGVRVVNELGTFRFSQRSNASLSGGFLRKDDKSTADAKTSSLPITEAELKSGYYEAGFYDRKSLTPAAWVYVNADNSESGVNWIKAPVSLWIDPDFFSVISLEDFGNKTKPVEKRE